MQAGAKNIEQPELFLPYHNWKIFWELRNYQEIIWRKVAIAIKCSAYISDFLSGCYSILLTGMKSLSLKSGFDRKIYLHNITEESGTFVKNSDFQNLLKV